MITTVQKTSTRETLFQRFTDSFGIIDDGPTLKHRMDKDGFLFQPGLLPVDDVLEARAAMLKILVNAGWIGTTHPVDSTVPTMENLCVEPEPPFIKVYYKERSHKTLNAFQHHSALIGLFDRMLGGEIRAHPGITARNISPNKVAFTTPPHQDFTATQGATNHYAAWIPLGDCGIAMGGLEIARGSPKYGIYRIHPALGAGQLITVIEHPQEWEYSPCAAGDVIIHNNLTLHHGVPNQNGRMRLSMDYCYQRADEPVCRRSLNPSHQLATWEELYSGWDDDEYKHYWHDLELNIVDFDNKYLDQRDELTIEKGHACNIQVRSCLEGVIQKHRDPEFRRRAGVALVVLKAVVA